jgi:hypothetical protein
MEEKELREYLYQPNSETTQSYWARIRKLSAIDLQAALRLGNLSRANRTFINGLILDHKRDEPSEDPHPDGWYDR